MNSPAYAGSEGFAGATKWAEKLRPIAGLNVDKPGIRPDVIGEAQRLTPQKPEGATGTGGPPQSRSPSAGVRLTLDRRRLVGHARRQQASDFLK